MFKRLFLKYLILTCTIFSSSVMVSSNAFADTVTIDGVYRVDLLPKIGNKWYVATNSISIPPVDYHNYIPVGPLTETDQYGNPTSDQVLSVGSYYTFSGNKYPLTYIDRTSMIITVDGEPVHLNRIALGSNLHINSDDNVNIDNNNSNVDNLNLESDKQAGISGYYNGGHSYPVGQCTGFVANILASHGVGENKIQYLGNGQDWANNARNRGILVDMNPTPGSVVCFKSGGWYGNYGHVAYVTRNNGNGTFHIYEGNWSNMAFHERDVVLNGQIAGIIHF